MSGLKIVELLGESYGREIGLKVDDILQKLNGNSLSAVNDLTSLLNTNLGKKVIYTVSREGEEFHLEAAASSLGVMLIPNDDGASKLEATPQSLASTKTSYTFPFLFLTVIAALIFVATWWQSDTTSDHALSERRNEKSKDTSAVPFNDEDIRRIVESSGVFRYGKIEPQFGKATGKHFGLLVVHPAEGVSASALAKDSGDSIGEWLTSALCSQDLREWLSKNRRWSPLLMKLESDAEVVAASTCLSARQASQIPSSSVSGVARSTQLSDPFGNYQTARSHFGRFLNCGWEKESPPDRWGDYRLWSCKYREEFTDTVAFYINEGSQGSVDSYKLLWRVNGLNKVVLQEAMVWRKIVANALGIPEIAEPISWSTLERESTRVKYTRGDDGPTATHVIKVESLK